VAKELSNLSLRGNFVEDFPGFAIHNLLLSGTKKARGYITGSPFLQ
jgi:hypothetical protein